MATNYTKTPDDRPWARDLFVGDFLTETQSNCVCHYRLSEFGMHLRPFKSGYRVERMTARDERERLANTCGNRGYA
jgi:hypothetical protein